MTINVNKSLNRLKVTLRYVFYRATSELTAETSRTYLSYIWWLLEPALTIAVFYVVFGLLFDRGGEGFVSFLMLGVTAWFWFRNSIGRSVSSIRREIGLMSQVYVPKFAFPLSAVVFMSLKHLFVILVLFGLLFFMVDPSGTWFFYLLIVVVQFIFILGLSFIVAAVVPIIPDLILVIPPLLRLTMFLSGVFYSQEMIPSEYVQYFRYNPMAGLIMEYRKVILFDQFPDYIYLFKVSLLSLALLAFGIWLLKKLDRVYPRLTK